jgi:hypothetical protein
MSIYHYRDSSRVTSNSDVDYPHRGPKPWNSPALPLWIGYSERSRRYNLQEYLSLKKLLDKRKQRIQIGKRAKQESVGHSKNGVEANPTTDSSLKPLQGHSVFPRIINASASSCGDTHPVSQRRMRSRPREWHLDDRK